MARRVRMLDENTINQIAAGEVIEGPHSVVKELIENAMDAHATKIQVEIRDGGKSFIKISDNGSGIDPEDMDWVFERHCTSKIKEIKDLDELNTLGFRGEALASIASVSEVEMVSRKKDCDTGMSIALSGGEVVQKKEVSANQGTTLIIRNLFFNTPARRKFMKTSKAETTKVNEVMTRLAIAESTIGFKYVNNNNIMFTTSGNGNLSDVLLSIFPKDFYKNMLKVQGGGEIRKVQGFISQPMYTRGNRNLQIFFVNQRLVKSSLITKALEEAYENTVMTKRFPISILHLSIPSREIDVNIHPSKTEVKFYNESDVYGFIYETVKESLSRNNRIYEPTKNHKIPSVSASEERFQKENNTRDHHKKEGSIASSFDIPSTKPSSERELLKRTKEFDKTLQSKLNKQIESEDRESLNDTLITIQEKQESFKTAKNHGHDSLPYTLDPLHGFKLFGQIFTSYILFQEKDFLFLIDQHAAHERMLYENYKRAVNYKEIVRQRLLKPESIQLSYEDFSHFQLHKEQFEAVGYTIEEFGKNTILIREVPVVIGMPKNTSFILEIIDRLKSQEKEKDLQEIIIEKSCKAAVKANQKLDNKEIIHLLEGILDLKPPYHCPHGRPIIMMVQEKEIEKLFKRIP